MAQRTGADGLIALKSRLTSAGICVPALVVLFVLALSGCGGGSDQPTASAPGTQASAQRAKEAPQATSPQAAAKAEKSKDPTGSSSDQDPAAAAAKQGPRIAIPKGKREQAPSSAEEAHSTLASMVLEGPDLPAVGHSEARLLPANTCDGKNSWPALRWRGVPPEAAELVLFVIGLEPVNQALFFNWALAGLDPGLQSIEAGRLPKGAIVGRNSFGKDGYSICPPPGKAETYIFALYALPKPLTPQRGFDPTALRKEILALAGNVGLMAASYER